MKKLTLLLIMAFGLITSAFAGMADDPLLYKFTMEKLEVKSTSDYPVEWEADLWIGKDLNKVYLYTEGEHENGETESENQLLYSRAISPFWVLQLGIGYDTTPDADQIWGVVALQGLAPYYIETRVLLLINDEGTIGVRFETEYEALLTQRLVLTPSLETELYTEDIPKMEIGSGLSALNLGLRLRYEIRREFAPYIGVEWEKTYGNTRDYNDIDEARAVAGFRFWF
ncbi:MAG: copper resistance protein B [Sulfurimonadaceae bacterium]